MRLFTILSICVATLVPSSALLAQTGTSTETETPQYSLTIGEDSITAGDSITVDYENTLPRTGDWIGLYRTGTANTQYIQWEFAGGTSGSVSFVVNQTGTYEFRYFSGSGYTRVAVSDPFTVTAGGGGGGTETYLLTLSTDSITAGDSITVDYENTLPRTGDWIGLYRTGTANTQYIQWEFAGGTSGSVSFVVNQTGTYEFRYFSGSGYTRVAVSDPFTVTAGGGGGGTETYLLTLSTDSITAGDSITVDYENTLPRTGDWIGLYRTGTANTQYIQWEFAGGTSGSVSFVVNQTGTYEFRYFSGSGYTRVAVSDPFTVTAGGGGGGTETYLLTLSTDSITAGDSITVDYENTLPRTGDWIGLYRTGTANTQYIQWEFAGGTSGSVSFVVNQTGTYEFRYFSGSGYTRVAVSDPFTVTAGGGGGGTETYLLTLSTDSITAGDSITVDYENTLPRTGDWIGLYRTGTANTQYIQWEFAGGTSGSVSFVVNQTGTYEFRYFSGSGYTRVAVSDPFTVTAGGGGGGTETYLLTLSTDSITAGDSITVDYENTLPRTGDWIGLYRTGTANTQYIQWEFAGGTSGSVSFVVNQTGTYEFRYFSGSGYTRVAVSDPFTVTAGGGGGNVPGYSLTTNRTNYERGETAFVTWTVPYGQSYFLNWIGLYEPGAPDTDYLYFEYVDFLSRTETFPLDNDGFYEFRFFRNNTFNRVAVSDRITVFNNTSASCNIDTSDITNFPPPAGPIVAFGDSLTFGIGATEGEDYVSELEDRLSTNIINEGVSGDTTRDALARLESDVLSRDPSAVIVFLGGNDEIRRFYEQLSDNLADRNLKDNLDQLAERIGYDWMDVPLIPREETFANIESIIAQIQATGAVTVLVGFDTAIYDSTIADDYQAIADNTNSFYVPDIFEGVFGRPRFMSDLVHPNDAGYDFFADRIQPAVACVLP